MLKIPVGALGECCGDDANDHDEDDTPGAAKKSEGGSIKTGLSSRETMKGTGCPKTEPWCGNYGRMNNDTVEPR